MALNVLPIVNASAIVAKVELTHFVLTESQTDHVAVLIKNIHLEIAHIMYATKRQKLVMRVATISRVSPANANQDGLLVRVRRFIPKIHLG